MSEGRSLDRWADWLLHGRVRNAPKIHERRQAAHLRRVRDRVLRGASMRKGHSMLDVGTGTGMLALEARRRLGPDGLVTALDVSLDCLVECRQAASAQDARDAGARLQLVQGDALALPFGDSRFDAVTARSVLIYVDDHVRGLAEMRRVLKPGGHVSLFEPVNKVYRAPNVLADEPALAPIGADHERVISHMWEGSEFMERISSFDERDLLRDFQEAGFHSVELAFEQRVDMHTAAAWEARTFIFTRPDPGTMSYEESAREVLGARADAHLRRFAELLTSTPYRLVLAWAFVTARKPEE